MIFNFSFFNLNRLSSWYEKNIEIIKMLIKLFFMRFNVAFNVISACKIKIMYLNCFI